MITYIITHKGSDKFRNRNLLYILDWLENINNISKVIVVEQDTESRIELSKSYRFELNHIFLENNTETFNKCWAYNVGFKSDDSNNEWLGFGDNDVIMDSETLNNNIHHGIDKYHTFSPYKAVRDLNNIPTQKFIEGNPLPRDVRNIRKVGSPFCGGMFFIRKDAFYKCGGWNEKFVNWGGEDDELSNRIKSFKTHHYDDEAIHLYHERSINSTNKNPLYRDNLNEYRRSIQGYGYKFDWNLMGDISKYK